MGLADLSFPAAFSPALRTSLSAAGKQNPPPRRGARFARLAAYWIPELWQSVKTAAPLGGVMLTFALLHLAGIPTPSPGLPLLAAIAYAGFAAGMQAGLTATVISIVYELVAFSDLPRQFTYTPAHVIRVGTFSLSALIIAAIVGVLRKRVELATYARVHHQAVETWRADWASLQKVLHQLPLGVLVADAESGEITFANDRARAILGNNVARLHTVGFPCMNHIDTGRSYSPDEWPLRRCVQDRTAIQEEFLYVHENGRLLMIHAEANPVYNDAGIAIAAVMSLTDRRPEALSLVS